MNTDNTTSTNNNATSEAAAPQAATPRPYKPTAPAEQARQVLRWLITSTGLPPAEAEARLKSMSTKGLRRYYQNLVTTGAIQQ